MAIGNQYKFTDRLGSFAQTVGRIPFNLPVGNVLTDLYLRVRYTMTNGSSGPSGAFYGAILQLAQIIQRLEVVINGDDTIWSVSPWLYLMRYINERHGLFPLGFENALSTAGSNAVTNVDITIPLDFTMVRGRKRNDCAVDLRGIRMAQLIATFGSAASIWGTLNSAAITNLQVDVEGTYLLQVPVKDPKGRPMVFGVRQLDELNLQLVGANTATSLDIDQRSGLNLTSMAIAAITLSSSVPAGDDTGLINGSTFQGDFQLKSAGQVFGSITAKGLRARQRNEYNLIMAPQAGISGALNPEFAGLWMWDQRFDGKLTTGIPTGKLDANLQLKVNQNYTSGNTTLWVQREGVRKLQVGQSS